MTMTIYFTSDDDPAQLEPFMRCGACNENLCTVEEGDTLDVLNALANEHARECVGSLRRPSGEASRSITERADVETVERMRRELG